MHGVTYCEEMKLPMLLYAYTGEQKYLDAAVRADEKLLRHHLLPDGVPSSNEHLDGNDPLTSHETCDITDYTWSLGYYLMTTGDAVYADAIEKAVFNAGPGAVTKDFKALQYFSSVNQCHQRRMRMPSSGHLRPLPLTGCPGSMLKTETCWRGKVSKRRQPQKAVKHPWSVSISRSMPGYSSPKVTR